MRVWIGTSEASGDALAARWVTAIRQQRQDIQFIGFVGPQTIRAGAVALGRPVDGEMGIGAIRQWRRGYLQNARALEAIRGVDAVWTVDAPELHLRLAAAVKRLGIPRVHAVAPQVWAWRPWRAKSVVHQVDQLLCLFPFEPAWFPNSCAQWVGHPLIESIDQHQRLTQEHRWYALLPGSRLSEQQRLVPILSQVMAAIRRRDSKARFELVIPNYQEVSTALAQVADRVIRGAGHATADVAIVCSGTATLELAARGIPMVVLYPLDSSLLRWGRPWIDLDFIALPNILAGRQIVPEYLGQLNPELIAERAIELSGTSGAVVAQQLRRIAVGLGDRASQRGAEALMEAWHGI